MHCNEELKNKTMIDQQILKAMKLSKVVKDNCNDYSCFFQVKHVFYNNGRKAPESAESYEHPTLGSEQLTIGIPPRFDDIQADTAFNIDVSK